MKSGFVITCIGLTVYFGNPNLWGHTGPFDGMNFKGRIAFSSDGNYNDEDDWGAFPVAAAILDAFGMTSKLVHVDYCNILAANDDRFYNEMVESVLGAAERYKIPASVLFDCRKDLDATVDSIARAVNASSADDPLYYVLAGPMEVPYRGISKSDPARRKYVYCISHNVWNDGYNRTDAKLFRHNKRDVIPSGVNWIQCRDGNSNLAHPGGVGRQSAPEQWRLYHWLRDSRDANLRWIFSRLEAEGRADISDATMTYFLLTGDEDADLAKLKVLLDDKVRPPVIAQRATIRLEAENFRIIDGFVVEYGDRNVSKRLQTRLTGPTGRIATPFDDIYTADGRYDVEVRYFTEKPQGCRFRVLIDNVGAEITPDASESTWKSLTIADVVIRCNDEIAVEVTGEPSARVRIDYIEVHRRGPAPPRDHKASQ
jgi:hypothetical protein